MEFYEWILLNTLYLITPLILYLFFVAYNQNIEKKENHLFFQIALFSSFYLCIRFGEISSKSILILNIPLLIAYLKKENFSIFLLSSFLVFYHTKELSIPIFYSILEYSTYFLLYQLLKKEKNYFYYFIILKIIIYGIYFSFLMSFKELFLSSLYFLIISIFILFIWKQAQNVLKYHMSIKELEQEKQIRTSLFKITHEIKNPIAVCKGYLDMFDVNNKEHAIKYIPIIKEEIERTLLLLQDFLSFTKVKIEPDILDIHLLLEESLKNFSYLFDEHHIQVETFIKDEEVYINGDYNRLCQVFINILKNSIEALEGKENSKIVVKTKIGKDTIKISIWDNGIGISEQNLSKISEPFFTTKKKGTGLGISLSKEIIKAHNGTIEYYSKENVETKVVITLPLLQNFN